MHQAKDNIFRVGRVDKKQIIGLTVLLSCFTGCVSTTTTYNQTHFEKDPKKAAKARTEMAAEYIRLGNLDQAKLSLDDAMRVNPHSLEANVMMGVLLQQEGSLKNMKLAGEYFKRALSIDPNSAQARNNYGSYLFINGDYQQAVTQFNIAGNTLGYLQRGTALENLGKSYLRLNDNTHAEQAFLQALQVNSDLVISKLELADLLYQQQRFTDASNMYDSFVQAAGEANQGARGLWVGLRLARARNDQVGMQVLANQLRAQYPDSPEYQRYLKLQNNSEAIWK